MTAVDRARPDADGELDATLRDSATLEADGTANDVPSNRVEVCVAADPRSARASTEGVIIGSRACRRDRGDARAGPIAARGGKDVVDLRWRWPRPGQLRRRARRGDRATPGDDNDHIAPSCERVKRQLMG